MSTFKKTGYKSIKPNVKSDWAKQPSGEPILDRELVAYGIVIESSRRLKKIFKKDENGEDVIDQSLFPDVIGDAIARFLSYYDKKDTPENIETIQASTIIRGVKVPPRPRSPAKFYVTIDAKVFDKVPEREAYTLQTVSAGDTLHTLAEKYKSYLKARGHTEISKRARIAEILRANSIDIDVADEEAIKDWIASVNEDATMKISFKEGAQIYLPNVNPPDESHPDIKHVAKLTVSEMAPQIEAVIELLRKYEPEIDIFNGKVENLDIKREIKLLEEFRPALRKHLNVNDLSIKDIFEDEIDIGYDKNFKPLFVTLDRSGERISLAKGLVVLEHTSPFNSPRTMAIISELDEISETRKEDSKWQDFVENYIFPPVEIKAITPDNLFSSLQSSATVMDQLANRYDKTNVKTEAAIAEEKAVFGNTEMMTAVNEQTKEASTFTGDLTISNLSGIAAKISANSGGAAAVSAAFGLLLNKISIESLMMAAIKCIQAQIPFTCEDVVTGLIEANIEVAAATFKSKIDPKYHGVVDEVLEFARTGDYEAFGERSSEMEREILNEDSAVADAEADVKFSVGIKVALRINTPLGYEEIQEKICAIVRDPIGEFNKFKIPVMNFPSDLVTVDIMSEVSVSLESAILETIVGLVLKLVETLIEEITNACSTVIDTFQDLDFGNADLAESVSDKVGAPELAGVLSDLFDSLGGSPAADSEAPSEETEETEEAEEEEDGTTTKEITYIDLKPIKTSRREKSRITADKVGNMKKLLDDLSALLTPSEISALFAGDASSSVQDIVVNVIEKRHPIINQKVKTRQDVLSLFEKLSKLADVKEITEQINVINKGLGCTMDDFCRRRDFILDNADLPPEDLEKLIEENTNDRIQTVCELVTLLEGGPLGDPANTFCEERGSDQDNGLIPKDNASLIFLIKKVVGIMYDGIYMAFDDEIVKLPDALDTIVETPKLVPRVQKQDWTIRIEGFDMKQLQEKVYEIEIPVPEGTPRRRKINPEFQRLLATGYVPVDGDPNGKYGPYTTEKIKAFGILPTPFSSFPLDPVIVNESFPQTAANSKAGLHNVKNMKIGTDSSFIEGNRAQSIYFSLTEPFKGQGFKAATFVLKYSLDPSRTENDFKNSFGLKIGNVPIDPSSIPAAAAAGAPNEYAPMEAAVYHTRLSGKIEVNEKALPLIEYLEQKVGDVVSKGNIPQFDVLAKFMGLIIGSGLDRSIPQLPPQTPRGSRTPELPPSPATIIAAAQGRSNDTVSFWRCC